MKVILCLALGLVVLSGGAWLWGMKTSASRQQTAADIRRARSEKTVLDNHRGEIDRAKAGGRNEVLLPASNEIRIGPSSSIEDIMRNYSLLRVKVKNKETVASEPYADIAVVLPAQSS
jgi:hypothetical protein